MNGCYANDKRHSEIRQCDVGQYVLADVKAPKIGKTGRITVTFRGEIQVG